MSSLFDIVQVPFGYLISFGYSLTHSYTVAMILFAVVAMIVLFPLNIKQQKNSQKQAALRPKEERIRKKYAGRNDQVTQRKMQQEIMDLYQEEHFSPFGGCLPMIIQLVLLLCLYTVVRNPLTYVAHLDQTTVDQVNSTVAALVAPADSSAEAQKALTSEAPATSADAEAPASTAADASASADASSSAPATTAARGNSYYEQIASVQYINNNESEFVKAYNEKYGSGTAEEIVKKVPVLKLFGVIDLGVVPSQKGLLSVPALFALISLLSAYLGQIITRKYTYQPAADAANQSTMKIMNLMMPLFSGYISYAVVPLAVTIYWIVQNLLRPVQQIILSKMFKIPTYTAEELKEMEKAAKREAKPVDDSRPKRRSLVYDDDDDPQPAPAASSDKPAPKAKPDDSPIEKARLKDDGGTKD